MSILVRMLRQDCVYWAPSGFDDFGQPIYAPPVHLKCRWEDDSQAFMNREGVMELSKAVVYVAAVSDTEEVEEEGILWLAITPTKLNNAPPPLDQINPSLKPFDNVGAAEVRRFAKLPDLKARRFLRTAYLGLTGVSHAPSNRRTGGT
jgi:hypothetical protein